MWDPQLKYPANLEKRMSKCKIPNCEWGDKRKHTENIWVCWFGAPTYAYIQTTNKPLFLKDQAIF